MSKTTCPVFRPTLEEFRNFSKYIDKIDEEIGHFGLCKVRFSAFNDTRRVNKQGGHGSGGRRGGCQKSSSMNPSYNDEHIAARRPHPRDYTAYIR